MGYRFPPPQEHAVLHNRPWYERYQVVSYKINSRSGNREQFANMVQRCNQVGVKIFVDAVINHMTGLDTLHDREYRIGNDGSRYERYNYPGTYSPFDFNICNRNGPDSPIQRYHDRWEVQNCNLVTLADLKTSSEYVRSRIATYLNDLLSLGVAGFRVDAAKHIPSGDLKAIFSKLDRHAEIFQEVIDHGNETISGHEYFGNGMVTEFRYGIELSRVIKNGKLDWMQKFGHSWGFFPDRNAISFVDNHDTQRSHSDLTYKDSSPYAMANVFMLAWPYGTPKIMSSYQFNSFEQGPPLTENGDVKPVYNAAGESQCYNQWVCEHRWQAIANMVHFRNIAENSPVTNWWSNGNNQIAFGRQGKGFVVLNNENHHFHLTLQTDLPAGKYCDVTTGSYADRNCSKEVIVHGDGKVTIDVPPRSSFAIHIGEKK